jgi:hypothetical protein
MFSPTVLTQGESNMLGPIETAILRVASVAAVSSLTASPGTRDADWRTGNYSGPVQLRPQRSGKRHPELARLLRTHMIGATPPVVIPWRPGMGRVLTWLRSHHVQDARIDDIQRLADHRASYRGDKA